MRATLRAARRLELFRRMARHAGVRVRVGPRQVAWGADDAIEVVAELDVVSEHALMYRAVRRRIMGEADAKRLPALFVLVAQNLHGS